MKWLAAAFLLLVVFVAPGSAVAQTPGPQPSGGPGETLRVAIREVRPFVFREGDTLTGFSIELWEQIAAQMGVRTTYISKSTVADLLDSTRATSAGTTEADLAISAISITEERERDWDFSQPMFDAGLQILVPDQGDTGNSLSGLIRSLLNPAFLPMLAFVVFGAIVAGHIVWLFERGHEGGLMEGKSYYPGIFEAIFWAASTLATQADRMPRTATARVIAVLWMFTAVVFIAFFTASVTSSLTVQQLRSDIQGPDDLPGKRVATVRNSTSADFLNARNIHTTEFDDVDQAITSLLNGDQDAVVYDAPILQYYASHDGKGKTDVVGSIFRKESYGILFPADSPLRKRVNEALLRLKENGTYDVLLTKWFGTQGTGATKAGT